MSQDNKHESKLVKQIRDNTSRYLHDLGDQNALLQQQVEILECDKNLLTAKVTDLDDELRRERSERRAMTQRLEAMKELRASSVEEYAIVEEQNNHLASLYTATYSLHGTLDCAELLMVIKEIVANLIGSEEMVILEYDSEEKVLRGVGSMGIDPDAYDRVAPELGLIGQAIRASKTLLVANSNDEDRESYEEHMTACVPLAVEGKLIGVIAVFRLLPQKKGLGDLDLELFELLARQAAMALYSARLHNECQAS